MSFREFLLNYIFLVLLLLSAPERYELTVYTFAVSASSHT